MDDVMNKKEAAILAQIDKLQQRFAKWDKYYNEELGYLYDSTLAKTIGRDVIIAKRNAAETSLQQHQKLIPEFLKHAVLLPETKLTDDAIKNYFTDIKSYVQEDIRTTMALAASKIPQERFALQREQRWLHAAMHLRKQLALGKPVMSKNFLSEFAKLDIKEACVAINNLPQNKLYSHAYRIISMLPALGINASKFDADKIAKAYMILKHASDMAYRDSITKAGNTFLQARADDFKDAFNIARNKLYLHPQHAMPMGFETLDKAQQKYYTQRFLTGENDADAIWKNIEKISKISAKKELDLALRNIDKLGAKINIKDNPGIYQMFLENFIVVDKISLMQKRVHDYMTANGATEYQQQELQRLTNEVTALQDIIRNDMLHVCDILPASQNKQSIANNFMQHIIQNSYLAKGAVELSGLGKISHHVKDKIDYIVGKFNNLKNKIPKKKNIVAQNQLSLSQREVLKKYTKQFPGESNLEKTKNFIKKIKQNSKSGIASVVNDAKKHGLKLLLKLVLKETSKLLANIIKKYRTGFIAAAVILGSMTGFGALVSIAALAGGVNLIGAMAIMGTSVGLFAGAGVYAAAKVLEPAENKLHRKALKNIKNNHEQSLVTINANAKNSAVKKCLQALNKHLNGQTQLVQQRVAALEPKKVAKTEFAHIQRNITHELDHLKAMQQVCKKINSLLHKNPNAIKKLQEIISDYLNYDFHAYHKKHITHSDLQINKVHVAALQDVKQMDQARKTDSKAKGPRSRANFIKSKQAQHTKRRANKKVIVNQYGRAHKSVVDMVVIKNLVQKLKSE